MTKRINNNTYYSIIILLHIVLVIFLRSILLYNYLNTQYIINVYQYEIVFLLFHIAMIHD